MGQMQEINRKIVSKVIVAIIALAMVLPVGFMLTEAEETGTPIELSAPISDTFYAQNDMIMMANAQFDVKTGPQGLAREMFIEKYDDRVSGYYLVKFDNAIDEYWVASLKAMGATIGSYVPYNTYIVKMNADTLAEVEDLPFVRSVSIYQPAFRVQQSLLQGVALQPGMQSASALKHIGWTNLWEQASPLGFKEDRTTVTIILHENENPNNLAALIGKTGGKVLAKTDNSLRAEISKQGLQALAFVNDVEYVMPYFANELMLDDTAWTEQSKVSGSTPVWAAGIHGEGIIVGIADTGLNTDHEMFRHVGYTPSNWIGSSPTHRKVVGYHQLGDNNVDYDGHGSHVTGIAVGNGDYVGSTNADRFGMAYEAKVSFCDIGMDLDASLGGIPDDLKTMYALQKADGASMASNSWGIPCINSVTGLRTFMEGKYTEDALNSDWYMWDNKEFLVFFSAGNDGDSGVSDGPAYTTTTTPPATAKNIVTVASHRAGANWNQISVFSSWGPTNDGRLKPDIASTGDGLTDWSGQTGDYNSAGTDSNRDGNLDTAYAGMQGTSMSSPCALGDAALLAQYYRDGYYPVTASSPVALNGFVPSNALLKATMINGARDATTGTYSNEAVAQYTLNGHTMAYPNGNQGWGMVDTSDSLYFNGDAREVWMDDNKAGLITDQVREYKIGVGAGQELEFTLVWTDYRGKALTNGALENDLDLTIIDPLGVVYYGNNYGATSRESDPTNPAGYDHINPVECVLVKVPTQGEWTIRIKAVNIPKGPQPYAIVVAANLDDGYGWVRTDKMVYKPGDTMTMIVEDTNVTSGTLNVQVTSSTGDVETRTLTENAANARKFTGTIAVNALTPVSGNGAISIQNNGWISVKYSDVAPAHDSYANVTTLMSSPGVTDVYVDEISNTAAIVHWTTDVPATSQVFYGLTGALGSSTTQDNDMVLDHDVVILNLAGFTNYYFDVQSVSIGGVTTRDTNGGDHYMFTTTDNPDILIVQEHDNIDASDEQVDDWRLSLGYYGWSFTVWETIKYGYPTLAALNSAKAVYWDVGEGYSQLGATERALLQSWMDQPGQQKFYATGQDIGWDMCDAAGGATDVDVAWYNTYMRATFVRDDADGGGGTEGVRFQILPTTHQISTGLPAQDLESDVYSGVSNGNRFWPDEIINDRGGQVPPPWTYTRYTGAGDCAAIAYDAATYKMIYEPFAHAQIQDDGTFGTPGNIFGTDLNMDRATIADRSIIWLMGGDHPDVTVLNNNGQAEDGTWSGTRTITWTVANAVSQSVQISKDGGQSYVVEATGLAGTATSYVWDTTTTTAGIPDYPNGENYKVKILAQGATLKGFDVSDNVFTIDNGAAGDKTGPVIVAGSIKVDPLPGGQGNTLTFDAKADDRAKGNSNIAAAEYFIDATGANGAGTAMTAKDLSWDNPRENITGTYVANIAQGSHIVFVHAQDAAGNWGGYEQFTFQINEGGPEVFVTAPNTAENIVSGSLAITWTATDYTDSSASLDINVEYSANGGGSWISIYSSGTNPSSYNWDTTLVPDGVNYLIRVTATDSFPLSGSDECDFVFSIDNIVDDRWHLQVETTSGNNDTNMMPVESSLQTISSETITTIGDFMVGKWQTTKTFASATIDGPWTFNVYGAVSSDIGDGVLYAIVKSSGGTTLDTTIYDTEDVFDFSNSHMFTWTDTLAGPITAGEGIIVELWVHVTYVSPGVILTTTGTTQAGGPHEVWFCAVDGAVNSEFDTPNPEAATAEWTDTFYTDGGTSNDVRAGPSGDPGIGDEIFVKSTFATSANPALVSQINLTFEGYWSVAVTATMYARNMNTDNWDALGATMAFSATTDGTMTRSITTGFADYIFGGQIIWGVYGSARGTCSVDYLEVAIIIPPSATFDAHFDYATAQSNIQPTITGGTTTTPYAINLTGIAANSWVFVSFPSAMSGNIETILDDAAAGDDGTNWTVAKTYDNLNKRWLTYRVGSTTNTFTNIDNMMGVWLWITDNGGDQELTLSSYAANSTVNVLINLYAGWNLVGYPTATSRAETTTLPTQADMVSVWQAATPYISDHAKGADMMVAGNAYWVRVTVDCVWTVQP
ncbi:MAG: S8 family serine peptidase [Candidatus Thermoplasmatota archaeon]|nr:S8 family serine peptidase [Candidatus Thermoplasmatota archaeon]MBU4591329.1 S8 family serine peptidase [Candidatus Thermoplasmatota archaeon]